MSDINTPIIVSSTSTSNYNYPQVSRIEEEEDNNNNNNNNNNIQVYATPINDNQEYHIPIYAEIIQPHSNNQQRSIYNDTIVITNPSIHVENNLNENVLRILALSRSLRCFTVVDAISVIIGAIFQLYWLFFLWGPIAGYYGATRYRLYFLYCYMIYWITRILIDILYLASGYWWYIISLMIDLYILRYVRINVLALKSLTEEQLEFLQEFQRNQNINSNSNYLQNP